MLLDKFSDSILSSAVLTRPTMGEGENGMKLKSFTAHVSKRWFDNQISISIFHQIAQVHHISWTQLKYIDIWKHLNSRHVLIGNFFALPFSWEELLREGGLTILFRGRKSHPFLFDDLLIIYCRVVHKLRWQDFGFFWPPTPLCWHFLWYERCRNVDKKWTF